MINPIIGMLFNAQLNRWHPIVYQESPLPGPASTDKPIRHKSVGHHTEGFETRAAAVAEADNMAKKIVEKGHSPTCNLCLAEDLPWDGADIPADTAFFIETPEGVKRAF